MNKAIIAAVVLFAYFIYSSGGMSGLSDAPLAGLEVPATGAAAQTTPAPLAGQPPVPPALAEAGSTGGTFAWPDNVDTWTDSHGDIYVPADVPVENPDHMSFHETGVPHGHLGPVNTIVP